jgi:uncharacterized protein YdhG (YjbR/CyaY superfamily)
MDDKKAGFKSIDEYIATFPKEAQIKLEELRAIIKAAAPDAKEKISYQMPAFAQAGNLVYFAGWKNHIGFYPGSSDAVLEVFKDELSGYKLTKGSIHFPIDKPLPDKLIAEIVNYRVAENLNKAEAKSRKRK